MPIWSAIILLFLVMDPIGNVPLFVSALAQVEASRRTRVLVRELLAALAALLAFLIAGPYVLRGLHMSEPALSVAGGVVLFLIAVRMIFPTREGIFGEVPEGEPFIVPLAIPLLAGPSTLAMILVLAAREPHGFLKWLVSIGAAWAISSAILLVSVPLSRLLGARGLGAVERLMGMVLVTIAVQMFLSGLGQFMGRPAAF
jgi:MarC family membrane protein